MLGLRARLQVDRWHRLVAARPRRVARTYGGSTAAARLRGGELDTLHQPALPQEGEGEGEAAVHSNRTVCFRPRLEMVRAI